MPDPSSKAPPKLYIGWYDLHPDVSLNFQLNRWASIGGPEWLADVRPVLPSLTSYDAWINSFVALGETAVSQGRTLHAALHFRCAEFFMTPSDPRKEPLRKQLLAMLREALGVDASARQEVPYGGLQLPVWHFPAQGALGVALVFGGFDSYIEELFPVLLHMREEAGWSVIAFEGPGQGSVLEDQHAPMTPQWQGPVSAVIDALGLDDVTLIGVSLGGCLAIRAAAFESRVSRVVAFDVLTDMFECTTRQQPVAVSMALRGLLALGAAKLIDEPMRVVAHQRPVVEWGLAQAMHVFGCSSPSEAVEATRAYQTRDISGRVRQDVLLMAGSEDHYVPLEQLWEQGRLLSAARSITARVFTTQEYGQAHCQVGNIPLAIRVFSEWRKSLDK
jgi:pimeloyl-ACP methyl ester carboxylesterase